MGLTPAVREAVERLRYVDREIWDDIAGALEAAKEGHYSPDMDELDCTLLLDLLWLYRHAAPTLLAATPAQASAPVQAVPPVDAPDAKDRIIKAAEARIDELEQLCAETYQVVGVLLDDTGQFETEQALKILDNLSQHRRIHDDVLPWAGREPVSDAELERRTGEPHIDGWPLYSGLPPAKEQP